MKSLLLLLVTLCATLTVYAEVAVARFDFANPDKTDTGHNWPGEGNWSNAFTKACKARTNGIGIAPASSSGGQSGMKYTCPEGETETIRQLSVTCMASGATAAKETNFYTLGISINGESVDSDPFTFNGKIDTPHTIVFTFDDAVLASSIVITNETDQANNSSLFEIYAVEWQSACSEINASFSAPSAITINSQMKVELHAISGGSGVYTESYFTFITDDKVYVENGIGTITFLSPQESGVYPLTLTIVDSEGTRATFTRNITVTPYVAPTNLLAFDITRSGFTLTWDQPLSTSIISYKAQVTPNPNNRTIPSFSPTWKAVGDEFYTETPIDLSEYCKDFPIQTLNLQAPQWTGDLYASADNGVSWVKGSYFGIQWNFPGLAKDAKSILLKTTESAPPQKIKVIIVFDLVAEKAFAATGDNHILSITDLPPGETYSVTVSAVYQKNENETVTRGSKSYILSLLPIPTFKSVSVNTERERITLAWPEGDEDLEGCCQFFGTQITPSNLSPGLYLTRVYKTESDQSTGLSRGRAFVITNTSQKEIPLDGSYTYSIKNNENGKVYSWDFSVEDDYPYTVPAGGECIIYSQNHPPLDLPDNAISSTKQAVIYIATKYTLSLKKGSTLCNSLTPVENAIVRLKADSLEPETHEITSTSSSLDALYAPWIELYKTVLLGEVTFESMNGQLQFYYSKYLTNRETLLDAEAHCFLQDGHSRSEKIVLPIYKAEPATKPGFLLRLH